MGLSLATRQPVGTSSALSSYPVTGRRVPELLQCGWQAPPAQPRRPGCACCSCSQKGGLCLSRHLLPSRSARVDPASAESGPRGGLESRSCRLLCVCASQQSSLKSPHLWLLGTHRTSPAGLHPLCLHGEVLTGWLLLSPFFLEFIYFKVRSLMFSAQQGCGD